jgi:hypothetical protein
MADQDINAVLRSQEYYRLKQVVQSPGDIYEINESAKAIYIGPDSDIGEVQVTYFNPDEPSALETAVVSVNGPFVGRVDALPKTRVPSTGQPARILVTPVDIVDPNYSFAATAAARSFNVPAQIDLIVALKTLPTIPAVRADRTLRLAGVPFYSKAFGMLDDGSTDLFFPIYGRRMATVTLIGNGVTARLGLITLTPGPGFPFPNQTLRELGQFGVPATIPPISFSNAVVYRASDAARQGLALDPATGAYQSFTCESDQPPDPRFASGDPTFGPAPLPRGLADLLWVNVRQMAPEFALFTRYCDVFVKVSDREN